VAFAELQSLPQDELQDISAGTGVSVELQMNSALDVYYINGGTGGGGIKIEALQLVSTDPSTGALLATPSSAVTEFDVVSTNGGALQATSTFAANSAINIRAIRLGSSNNASGTTAFSNVRSNTSAAAASLGQVNITSLSGQAVVSVRGH
jgi:hypothetical protein